MLRGAKFRLRVISELKNRGVVDVLIAVVDGLKGFPEAITAVFPQAQMQTCIGHLIRGSLEFVSWKDRRTVNAALKLLFLVLNQACKDRKMPPREWGMARAQFAIQESMQKCGAVG